MSLDFKNEGDVLFLLGASRDDISSSEYLYSYCGVKNSPAPYIDLDEELRLHDLVKTLIKGGLIQSAHDVSDGGLFVTLIEAAIPGGKGFKIETDEDFRKDAFLFGESQSRIVVSVHPDKLDAFVELVADSEVDFTNLGEVTGEKVIIDNEDFGDLSHFQDLYENSIGRMMEEN
jgi:phosphoribosylformylglycinamidine synthase